MGRERKVMNTYVIDATSIDALSTRHTSTDAASTDAAKTGHTSAHGPRTRAASAAHLSDLDLERFGAELDAIRAEVLDDLGESDARYIRRVIAAQRGLEVGGRGLLLISLFPPAWLAGTAALAASKILENMEIGHNVLHG